MEETVSRDDALLAQGRDFIEMLREKDISTPLDFSPESIDFCQWFLETLEQVDDARYKSRVYIAMAVYVADYMISKGSGFRLNIIWGDNNRLEELQIVQGPRTFNVLSLVIKASQNPESDNLASKLRHFEKAYLQPV